VGASLGVAAIVNHGSVSSNCIDTQCTQEGIDAVGRGRALAAGSTALFAGGAVIGLAGAALVLFDRGGGSASARLAPTVGDRAVGFAFSGIMP
jgi:hypothetical protein